MEQSNEEMTIEELRYRLEEEKINNLTIPELKQIIREVVSEELIKRYPNYPTYVVPVYPPYKYEQPYHVYCTDHTVINKEIL